jgi:uncharacterized protein (DUF362 family)/Pyruvate/2-oxoacid:ferredoxin oxidoreductase delta subunit
MPEDHPYSVSVQKCDSYDDVTLNDAVNRCLEPLGGLESVVKKGDRVLIKINLLSSKKPEAAVTTNPALVKAVIKKVQALGATPIVGDSPGGRSTSSSYEALLVNTGIRKVADETGCEIVEFDKDVIEYTSEKASTFKKLKIAKIVTDVDAVICLPKLKTHQLTYYTGAVKLLYGYIPGMTKAEYHLNTGKDISLFAELLCDLNVMFPPSISIMDAVVAMEGNGPQSGEPRKVGLILASKNNMALDFVASSIIGMDPMAVPTVKKAYERKMGPGKMSEISVYGEDPSAVMIKDFKPAASMSMSKVPPFILSIASGAFATRPVVDRKMCVKCGKCAAACPPKSMKFVKATIPNVDYKTCIRCYCCQELCPEGAISVQQPWIRRFMK